MNDSCRASYNCGGQVAFVFRLPIVGGKLHLSSGCPPDKLNPLAYF